MRNGTYFSSLAALIARGTLLLLSIILLGTAPAFAGFSVIDSTANTVTLKWRAPGDDGNVGTASQYDLRWSTSLITDANWGQAHRLLGMATPRPAGDTETAVVAGLYPNTQYFFAVKTADEAPNWSVMSPVISTHTLDGSPPPDTTHTDECTNIAVGLAALISDLYSGYSVDPITDGEIAPYGGAATTTATGDTPGLPHWIEIDFGSVRTVKRVNVYWAWNEYSGGWMTSSQYYIQSWDGAQFQNITTVNNSASDSATSTECPDVPTSRIRIYQPADMGPAAYSGVMWVTEVEICGLDQSTADSTGPVITDVTAENITPISAGLRWSTDESATSQVQYGATAQYGSSTSINYDLTTSHAVDLYGLSPSTMYHFRAISIDSSGNVSSGEDFTFTTLPLGAGTDGSLASASPTVFTVVRPTLRVVNLDNNPANVYAFDVANDSVFTDVVATSPAVQQQTGSSTSWILTEDLEKGKTYYWKVVLNDLVTGGPFALSIETETYAYPNPFRLEEVSEVTFTGIPQGGSLVIMTISGELVKRWTDSSGDDIIWDGTNQSDHPVASGTYLWYLEDSDTRGKIMVIR